MFGLLLALVGVFATPARSEPVPVTFEFEPPEVGTPDVFLLPDPHRAPDAGQPLSWQQDKLLLDLPGGKDKSVYLSFNKLPGYLSVIQVLTGPEVEQVARTGHWPRPVRFTRNEVKHVFVSTYPRGAAIFARTPGSAGFELIGVADDPSRPADLILSSFWDPTLPDGVRDPELAFVLPNPTRRYSSWEELRDASDCVADFSPCQGFWVSHPAGHPEVVLWPPEGSPPVRLVSRNRATGVLYFVRDHGALMVVCGFVTLGAVLWIALALVRGFRARRRAEDRMAALEAQLSGHKGGASCLNREGKSF